MRIRGIYIALIVMGIIAAAGATYWLLSTPFETRLKPEPRPGPPDREDQPLAAQGMEIFRHDTYGNEEYFTETLNLPFEVLLNTPAAAVERAFGIMTDKDDALVGIEEVEADDGTKRWGPARVDITFLSEVNDSLNSPTSIQAAFGTRDLKLFNWDGFFTDIEERNYFEAEFTMHGNGEFDIPEDWDTVNEDKGDGVDLIGPKMAPLKAYLDTLEPPPPPADLVNQDAAVRGEAIFMGKASCGQCHPPPLYTNHEQVASGQLNLNGLRSRSPILNVQGYKVPSLRGVWATDPYFHDGSARSLPAVISHYNRRFNLNLSDEEQEDLREFLTSLRYA